MRDPNDQTDFDNETANHTRDRDSIYSIFDQAQNEARKLLGKGPLKSSMRDISNERSASQNHKSVSFKENMSRNMAGLNATQSKCKTSQEDENPENLNQEDTFNDQDVSNFDAQNSKMSMSPFERSIANYKATSEKLIDAEMKRINERKKELSRKKREREMRNSRIKSFISSQNLSNSQIKNHQTTLSPNANMFDTDQDTTKDFNNSRPAINTTQNRQLRKSKDFNSYIGMNDDLEGVCINDKNRTQEIEVMPHKINEFAKRKLDYNDLMVNNKDEETEINLTPHILEESKLYDIDTSPRNSSIAKKHQK